MENENLESNVDARKEIDDLARQLEKTKKPDPADARRFRDLVSSTPSEWPHAIISIRAVQEQLIEKLTKGGSGPTGIYLLSELDVLKKQLDYERVPAVEQLLIEQILTARLRVMDAENRYTTCVVNESVSLSVGEYWSGILTATNSRYARAIEALLRVRRLARNTPALQINIAGEGGKQVNIQDYSNSH